MLLQDPLIRPFIFLALLVLFAVLEAQFPRRRRVLGQVQRWVGNFGILLVSTVIARVVLPIAPIGAALWAVQNETGLFNIIPMPVALEGVFAFLLLDLLIYGQHRVFHAVPLLWRIHRMHHTDMDFDVSTGIRFHPIEIFLSLIIKIIAVVAIGAHPLAVVVFEIALNGTSLFNHSNLALPASMDRAIRQIVVTPDMHRVHHSIRKDETNSNFGFNLPWWDYIFSTYRAQPADGHTKMTIGLDIFRDMRAARLVQLLIQPFITPIAQSGKQADNNSETPQPPG